MASDMLSLLSQRGNLHIRRQCRPNLRPDRAAMLPRERYHALVEPHGESEHTAELGARGYADNDGDGRHWVGRFRVPHFIRCAHPHSILPRRLALARIVTSRGWNDGSWSV